MKRVILITCVGVLAIAQTPVPHGTVLVQALRQERNGHVIHLTGNVTIENDGVTLRADQADYNEETAEIVAHGDVRVKLK